MTVAEALEEIVAGRVVKAGIYECSRVDDDTVEVYNHSNHDVIDLAHQDFLERHRAHVFELQS